MYRIGGMALNNGVLLQTDSFWAAAVRDGNGIVTTAGGAKPVAVSASRAVNQVPVLRGPLRMLDAVALMVEVRRRLPEARLPLEGASTLVAVALSMLGIGALKGLPSQKRGVGWLTEAGTAVLSLAPAMVALRGTALAGYHGAEHKSISRYELQESGSDQSLAAKEHERCGSNVVGPLLLTQALLNQTARKVFRQPPPGTNLFTGIVSLGVALEAVRWSLAHPQSALSGLFMAPGRFLQRNLTTREPSEAQMEVAESALLRLLELQAQA